MNLVIIMAINAHVTKLPYESKVKEEISFLKTPNLTAFNLLTLKLIKFSDEMTLSECKL